MRLLGRGSTEYEVYGNLSFEYMGYGTFTKTRILGWEMNHENGRDDEYYGYSKIQQYKY